MYNNSKNIFTGVLCAIVIAVIAVGVLFACGVFKKEVTSKTKLPITYPDKTINWMSLDDGKTLRAAFNDKLVTVPNGGNINIQYSINKFDFGGDKTARATFTCDLNSIDELGYEIWTVNPATSMTHHVDFIANGKDYCMNIYIYNNAVLNDKGDVTSGDGFVLEVGELVEKVSVTTDAGTSVEEKAIEITDFKLVSLSIVALDTPLK